jgi:hypothetical protein
MDDEVRGRRRADRDPRSQPEMECNRLSQPGANDEDNTKSCLPLDCVHSVARAAELLHSPLQPLAENNDPQLIYDPALEGKWKHPDRDDYCLLVISGDAKKREYALRYAAPAEHQDTCRCLSNGTDLTKVGLFSGFAISSSESAAIPKPIFEERERVARRRSFNASTRVARNGSGKARLEMKRRSRQLFSGLEPNASRV